MLFKIKLEREKKNGRIREYDRSVVKNSLNSNWLYKIEIYIAFNQPTY